MLMFDPLTSELNISYRPKNKNTYITVTREGKVNIRTPLRDEKRVRRLLIDKQEWINQKLTALASTHKKTFKLGDTILFRGEIIRIEKFQKLYENIQKGSNIEKYYYDFYKNEAMLTLPSRVAHYARKMNLYPASIRFKRMKRRWGSCDSNGVVTLNTMMMQLSYEHIDYIIVHELAHLCHMNHSKEFHAVVRSILKDEKLRRQQLRTQHPVF